MPSELTKVRRGVGVVASFRAGRVMRDVGWLRSKIKSNLYYGKNNLMKLLEKLNFGQDNAESEVAMYPFSWVKTHFDK